MKIRRFFTALDRYHWLILLLASPFLILISTRWVWVLLAVPLLWGLAFAARQNPLPRTPLNLALLLLWVMVLLSLHATYDISLSLPKIAGMVLGIGAFFAVMRYSAQATGLRRALVFYSLAGSAAALMGLLGMRWFSGKINLLDPLTARFPRLIQGLPGAVDGIHPNEVAGALLWVLPLLFSLTFWAGRRTLQTRNLRIKWAAALAGLAALLLTSVLVLTQSRAAYLSLAAVLIWMAWVNLPVRGRIIVPLLLAAVILGFGFWTSQNGNRLETLISTASGSLAAGQTFSLGTLDVRMEIWSRALFAVRDFPITGMGMNTFRYVVNVLYPLASVGAETDIGHAHNEFLQAALDLGIPGLITFLSLNIGAGLMLARAWRLAGDLDKEGRRLWSAVVLGLAGSMAAHILYGMTDAISLGAKPGVLFWLLLGLICAVYRSLTERSGDPVN